MLGFGDKALELYRMINPIEHSRTKEASKKYKVEPYVIPADIYGIGNLAGRGGWTWYTGSAGWFYKVGVQEILGIQKHGNKLKLNPKIPISWDGFKAVYTYEDTTYNIKVTKTENDSLRLDGQIQNSNTITLENDQRTHTIDIEIKK